jgi:hypothetical protein
MEKLSKESYAAALAEQIASRKALNFHGADEVPAPWAQPVLDKASLQHDRMMGLRYGGPMAPSQKDDYASALRAQIETRAAHRAAEAAADKIDPSGGCLGFGGAEASGVGCRRRHGAPPLPSKETYKKVLEEQMVARSLQQAEEVSRRQEHDANGAEDFQDALDEILLGGKGRRKGPVPLPAKSLYAAELDQQIAERKAEQYSNVEAPPNGFPGGDGAFSEQAEHIRGRRHSSKIDSVSKSALNTDLQGQMAERAVQRAANAFHMQVVDASPNSEPENVKGRRKCDLPAPSKHSYALALQEQIAQRKALQDLPPKAPVQSAFVGGLASDMQQGRGRRHAGQMVPVSKEDLRWDLQKQMAERARKEAAMRFHAVEEKRDSDVDVCADALEKLCANY